MASEIRHNHGSLFDDTPRGILEALLVAGGITVALSTSPVLLAALAGLGFVLKAEDKARKRKLSQYSSYVKGRKYITVRPIAKNRMRVDLTSLGRKKALDARARRLLAVPVERPKAWDHKWRLILFDIAAGEKHKRNAFRTFIKKIGAAMLQKSVWIHPFDCTEQIAILREFFNLSPDELQLVVAESIEYDRELRKHFKL
ncbi:hypothetical protein HYW59_04555 [Candidatus Kaiserbacteria bacterium]|nr:hypothetical protein [Candidatus Kaiserbacteria bacterium]